MIRTRRPTAGARRGGLSTVSSRWYYSNYLKSLGAIALWPMNELSGTTMIDASGNSYNGAYRDVSMLNQSVFLNNSPVPLWTPGNSDRANMYSAGLAAAMTYTKGSIVLWAKVRASSVWTDGTARTLLDFRSSVAGSIVRLARNATNNRLVATIRLGGVSKTPFFDTDANRNNWFQIVITWADSANGDAAKLYYNSVQQSTTQTGFGAATGSLAAQYATFGSVDNNTPAEFWDGYLGYGALFNRVLTQGDIDAMYANRFLA